MHVIMQDFIRFSYKLLIWKCDIHPRKVSTDIDINGDK